ncbi:MAG: hypothetical protein JJD93_11795 [Ilumatobacteraceae bacterium]|nr:hypothetical protein [Ilumatobacteraceae bacterium]
MSPARRWVQALRGSPAKLVSVLAVVAALVWWQWPTIAGHDKRTDVVLLTDGFLTSTELPVVNRIHEDGRSLRWDEAATSWCNAAGAVRDALDEFDPAAIVLSFSDATGCDATALTNAVHAANGHSVLIVAQPGRSGIESTTERAGATLIDPTRYIGDQLAATSLPCQWWETCIDGSVAVRTADGALTAEGSDRVARLIVAELP